jgi:hypothetical protein
LAFGDISDGVVPKGTFPNFDNRQVGDRTGILSDKKSKKFINNLNLTLIVVIAIIISEHGAQIPMGQLLGVLTRRDG